MEQEYPLHVVAVGRIRYSDLHLRVDGLGGGGAVGGLDLRGCRRRPPLNPPCHAGIRTLVGVQRAERKHEGRGPPAPE